MLAGCDEGSRECDEVSRVCWPGVIRVQGCHGIKGVIRVQGCHGIKRPPSLLPPNGAPGPR